MDKKQQLDETTGISGRQRLTWPVIESIGACAARLGVSRKEVSEAKAAGSKAFLAGGRIDTGILIPELFAARREGKGDALDPAQEKAKLSREQRIEKERENRIAAGEVAHLETVEALVWEKILLPLKQALEIMPDSLATLVNPQDPDHAKKILREWLEKTKASLREPEKKKEAD